MAQRTEKSTDLPSYVDGFSYPAKEEQFSLIGTDMVLTLRITRNCHTHELFAGKQLELTCYFGIGIGPCDAAKRSAEHKPVPRVRFFEHMTSSQDSSKKIRVTCARKSISIWLPSGEIEEIDIRERDRLLAFLNELRGVEIAYTPNLFGFLDKDGSDKEIITQLPFPMEATE
jgi:hypothetical protein